MHPQVAIAARQQRIDIVELAVGWQRQRLETLTVEARQAVLAAKPGIPVVVQLRGDMTDMQPIRRAPPAQRIALAADQQVVAVAEPQPALFVAAGADRHHLAWLLADVGHRLPLTPA